MSTVVFDAVTKTYGQTVAVKNLSLEIAEQEFFVIVGPSGAGKTTTLKLTAGLLPLTSGKLYIGGKLANSFSPAERNTAMTFESYALYPHMTVYENIANPLRSPGAKLNESEIRSRVVGIAELLGIGQLLERYPRELSGGQKQRVALGRAMVRKPSVFLLDEPLSHVDAKVRQHMRVEFNRIQRELKTTTIYVTHDYAEALALGDRVGVLNHGELIQVGPPHEVYSKPANEFVAKHVGQPEINLIDANVTSIDGTVRLLGVKNPKLQFVLEGKRAEVVKQSNCQSLRIGIRPHMLKCGPVGANKLVGEVYVFEPSVISGQLLVDFEGYMLTALTKASDRFETGQKVGFDVSPNDIYLFDLRTGENLEAAR
jgi:multiple sugar transport system ATP-binding protein